MKKIYVWGTGCEAQKCISNINYKKCKILGYIETKPSKTIWQEKKVYTPEVLLKVQYDYLIIANTFYDEIVEKRAVELNDRVRIIDWIKFSDCIYNYSEDVWELFTDKFFIENSYILDINKRNYSIDLFRKLDSYVKIYVYDLRLINCELDIGELISEILINRKSSGVGMAFIPNENLFDIDWYHNLLYVLDRKAIVIWHDEEGDYVEYIKKNSEKFSYRKFNILQFIRKEVRTVHKGRYMVFRPSLVYEDQLDLVKQAKHIEIFNLRCDRIGEEIRVLNSILLDKHETDIFKLYIPVDGYNRPFLGTNTCFNELVGRRLNILKNQEEYYLWIYDIFENCNRYDYDRRGIDVYHFDCGVWRENKPVLDFYQYELELGKRLINEKMNIKDKYVCMHSRDATYLKNTLPECDYSYHDYRDISFNIYNKAIDYLDSLKIQTVRVGQIAEQKNIHNKCINFVNRGYDEFLDLILFRFCKFFIGCDSGISLMTKIFGKPLVMLMSFYPYVTSNLFVHRRDLCIFKRVYSIEEQRELLFSEIFDVSIDFIYLGELKGEYYAQNNLELIPLSQEDVLDVVIEMNEKLEGTWKDHEGDARLHTIFDSKLRKSIQKYNINISEVLCIDVATSFLRRYKYLLED